MDDKWAKRFLELAELVASWSKDPSTQCGAVIVDNKNRIVSVGFNGFARGVDDGPARYDDRDIKYKMVLHAEENAILFATKDLAGCSLFVWPMLPCSLCAARIIQSGITDVYAVLPTKEQTDRWAEGFALAKQQFKEAGVSLTLAVYAGQEEDQRYYKEKTGNL